MLDKFTEWIDGRLENLADLIVEKERKMLVELFAETEFSVSISKSDDDADSPPEDPGYSLWLVRTAAECFAYTKKPEYKGNPVLEFYRDGNGMKWPIAKGEYFLVKYPAVLADSGSKYGGADRPADFYVYEVWIGDKEDKSLRGQYLYRQDVFAVNTIGAEL